MKKTSNNEPIKTSYYYCFLKDNNTFSLCAITESAHENAAIMKKLEKRFQVELSESEYRNIQETGGSGFIHEYYERLDAKKQSKQKQQKYIDAALVSSMLPKKRGERFFYSFDDSSAYITDTYRLLKTDKTGFIYFLRSKGYFNIEKGAQILPHEKECAMENKNTRNICELFCILKRFSEKRKTDIYTTTEDGTPKMYYQIGKAFFKYDHIEKAKKSGIDISFGLYYDRKKPIQFMRGNEVVYIVMPVIIPGTENVEPTAIITELEKEPEPEPTEGATHDKTQPHTSENKKADSITDTAEKMRENSEPVNDEPMEEPKTETVLKRHEIAYNNDITTDGQNTDTTQKQRQNKPKQATKEGINSTNKKPKKQEVKQSENVYQIPEIESIHEPSVALLGYTDSGKAVSVNFKETPHLLIAGATGAGKSIMLHSIICSLLQNNTTDSAQLVLIDPKRVELFDYTDSQMLYGGRIYEDVSDAVEVLEELTEVMNNRYIQLKYSHARNIDEMHNAGTMPRIYICIDELSFLMTCDKKRLETVISKIGMMGRAAGIHLIVCTQHPDRKTITGTIQANITAVVAMATRTATDSRMIAGSNICAKLRGRGDAVLIDGLREERFQGRYISQSDIHKTMEKQKKNEDSNPRRVDPAIMERIKQNILNRMKMN